MEKKMYYVSDHNKGLIFQKKDDGVSLYSFFGINAASTCGYPECEGLFFLDTDVGRTEGAKWKLLSCTEAQGRLELAMNTPQNTFTVRTVFAMDPATGVFSKKDTLTNNDKVPHTVYACVTRMPLHQDKLEVYGQSSGWCSENEGCWQTVSAGSVEFSNSMGRSTESGTPFACIRQKNTGYAAAIHILPIGDWVIRAKRIAGHRTAYTVLEMGLSDHGLRMEVAPGEQLELPEILFYGFEGEVENCTEGLHRYLAGRYPAPLCMDFIYNTWFLGFDVIDVQTLKKQIPIAKEMGCKHFVVDAGWFGKGTDWENQVGDWQESRDNAFFGNMKEFADAVRRVGMGFGLWMEPERAARGSNVYKAHPSWFMKQDAIIFDVTQPEVAKYLLEEINRLVETYGLSWMKVDFNTNMLRDTQGSNFYRYYMGCNRIMEQAVRQNPGCKFEGCASGGMRTDIRNTFEYYGGHFISDMVNPLEVIRMRQNAALRILPAFMGSWMVLQEIEFPVESYFDHEKDKRRKVLACADAWWDKSVDVSADLSAKIAAAGWMGISGDLTSLSKQTKQCIKKWADFQEKNKRTLSHSVCRLLTKAGMIDESTGWIVMQYSAVESRDVIIFAYRLNDDIGKFMCYPQDIDRNTTYTLWMDEAEEDRLSGGDVADKGIEINCPDYFSARVVRLAAQK